VQKKVVSLRSTALKVCIGDNTCLSEGKGEDVKFGELESFSDLVVLTELGEICTSVVTPIDDDVLQELNENNPRIDKIKISFFIILSIPPPSGGTNINNFDDPYFLDNNEKLCS